MTLSRISFRHLPLTLIIGCAILAFSSSSRALADPPKPVVLTAESLDKLEQANKNLKSDDEVKAQMAALGKDETFNSSMASGADLSDFVNSKYPKVAAALKDAELTPDEYFKTVMCMVMAATSPSGASEQNPQANIDFAKANAERINAILASMN